MRTINLEFFLEHKVIERVLSVSKLKDRLEELEEKFKHEKGGLGVNLEDEEQNFICIGLLPDKWSLIWGDGPTNMLYSQNSSNEQSYQGVYWEEWTGISLKEFIQKEQAWEAVKYWIETGKPSPKLKWTDEVP